MEAMRLSSNFLTLTAVFSGFLRRKVEGELSLTYNEYIALAAIRFEGVSSVTALAERLSLTPSRASTTTRELAERGLIEKRRSGGRCERIAITEEGESLMARSFELADEAYEEFIAPIDESSRASFVAGFIATAVVLIGMTYRGDILDIPVMCATVFLHTERIITKKSKEHGLSLADLRVLLAVARGSGSVSASQLSHYLIMSKSTVSESVGRLRRKALVTANRRDGRSSLLSIRAGAEDEVSEILRGVEAAAIGGMRPVRYDERSLYYKIVDQTVAALREGLA